MYNSIHGHGIGRCQKTKEIKMTTITTYSVSHALGRAATCTADADAICQTVNNSIRGSGDSIDRDAVQRELDAVATAETQEIFKITIHATESSEED